MAKAEPAETLCSTVMVDKGKGEWSRVVAAPRELSLAEGSLVNGRYLVLREIGRGGMGVVFLVLDELLDRELVLKMVVHPEFGSGNLDLLRAEFRVMASFQHPNLAGVYDFEGLPDSGELFFTMELVDGPDLLQASEELDWQGSLDLIVQLCRALAYVHRRGVIHHDLKPENVLVAAGRSRRPQVKVLDFGLAGAVSNKLMGTPAYMAPERFLEEGVDHRADLYSLGILWYQVLCRRLPFQSSSFVTVVTDHLFTPVVFPPEAADIPEWLQEIVLRLCSKKPEERFDTADAIIEAINDAGRMDHEVETPETRDGYLLSGPFVGRQGELRRLQRHVEAALSTAEHEAARMVVVTGPSGIGKSRLLREERHRAQLSRTPFVEGNCYEGDIDELAPVQAVLEHVISIARAHDMTALLGRRATALVRLCPGLEKLLPGLRPPTEPDADDTLRLVMRDAVQLLLEVSTSVPYVLCFNDLQWLRPAAVTFLDVLLDELGEQAGGGGSLALVGSARDDELEGRSISAMFRRRGADGTLESLSLHPFGAERVAELLEAMLGRVTLEPEVVAAIHEESVGNPFFIEELVRALIERDDLSVRRGRWVASAGIAELGFPRSLSDALLRRAGFLDELQREVLDLLATAGRPESAAVLAAAAGREQEAVEADLESLIRRQMVVLVGNRPLYHLRHNSIREALLGELAGARQSRLRRLHLRLGEALEQTGINNNNGQGRLVHMAHHFWEARDLDRALRYGLAAGAQAKRGYANALAIELLDRARGILEEQDGNDPRLLQVNEDVGDCLLLEGDFDGAAARYGFALGGSGDRLDRGRITRKLGEVSIQRDDLDAALEQFWQAVEILGGSRPANKTAWQAALAGNLTVHLARRVVPRLVRSTAGREQRRLLELAIANLKLCYVYNFADVMATPLPLLRAYNAAQRTGRTAVFGQLTASLGHLYGTASFFKTGERYCRLAVEIAEELDSPWSKAMAEARLGFVQYLGADWDGALASFASARDTFVKCRDFFELGHVVTHLFACYLAKGDLPLAEETVARELELLERSGKKWFYGHSAQAWHAYLRGKRRTMAPEQATANLQETIEHRESAGDLLGACAFYTLLGDLLLGEGLLDEARATLERGLELRETRGLRFDYDIASYPLLARTILELRRRDGDHARGLTSRSWRRAGALVRKSVALTNRRHPNHRAQALLSRAVFLWEKGKTKQALRVFEQSRTAARRQGALTWLAEVELQEGRCLSLCTNRELRQRAIACLERAESLFEQCDDKMGVARARALLEKA